MIQNKGQVVSSSLFDLIFNPNPTQSQSHSQSKPLVRMGSTADQQQINGERMK